MFKIRIKSDMQEFREYFGRLKGRSIAVCGRAIRLVSCDEGKEAREICIMATIDGELFLLLC